MQSHSNEQALVQQGFYPGNTSEKKTNKIMHAGGADATQAPVDAVGADAGEAQSNSAQLNPTQSSTGGSG